MSRSIIIYLQEADIKPPVSQTGIFALGLDALKHPKAQDQLKELDKPITPVPPKTITRKD
jgi:hypothetical protein